MRRFSSYGPPDTRLHYYAPREALIEQVLQQLVGDDPTIGGHYTTVWAPRQCGKTWIMQQIVLRLQQEPRYLDFAVAVLPLEHLKLQWDVHKVVQSIAHELIKALNLPDIQINTVDEFDRLFARDVLPKPLILILDEFDALDEEVISGIVGVLRNIYIRRQYEANKPAADKEYLLHGVALVGVRTVLGIENVRGSPFNVQRSLHIPNLTNTEVAELFAWYSQESGQVVEQSVIERLFVETQGQPGLVCWFGELLTETYNKQQPTITTQDFEIAYAAATHALPNNNILNIVSKARQEPYRQMVLEMFRTDARIEFRYDDPVTNFLYLNGVIEQEVVDETERYVKFSSPFVQKRLFHFFAEHFFHEMGRLYAPFENLEGTIGIQGIHIKNLMARYERYLRQNSAWLFKDAPRRSDLRLMEAVYHFNLYMYLTRFLESFGGRVYPEFPTGNGQIDLVIRYQEQIYGLELKSYTNEPTYQQALRQTAHYGQRLQRKEMFLILFVELIDDANRIRYEAPFVDAQRGVTVFPIFVVTL